MFKVQSGSALCSTWRLRAKWHSSLPSGKIGTERFYAERKGQGRNGKERFETSTRLLCAKLKKFCASAHRFCFARQPGQPATPTLFNQDDSSHNDEKGQEEFQKDKKSSRLPRKKKIFVTTSRLTISVLARDGMYSMMCIRSQQKKMTRFTSLGRSMKLYHRWLSVHWEDCAKSC